MPRLGDDAVLHGCIVHWVQLKQVAAGAAVVAEESNTGPRQTFFR